mmetsp:Transcript_94715/g.211612  ORF Transcript_94715/g.211612 Transcript_94715/m.211612 type:complete len:260 (-) Transcript_94715:34-813(-)
MRIARRQTRAVTPCAWIPKIVPKERKLMSPEPQGVHDLVHGERHSPVPSPARTEPVGLAESEKASYRPVFLIQMTNIGIAYCPLCRTLPIVTSSNIEHKVRILDTLSTLGNSALMTEPVWAIGAISEMLARNCGVRTALLEVLPDGGAATVSEHRGAMLLQAEAALHWSHFQRHRKPPHHGLQHVIPLPIFEFTEVLLQLLTMYMDAKRLPVLLFRRLQLPKRRLAGWAATPFTSKPPAQGRLHNWCGTGECPVAPQLG